MTGDETVAVVEDDHELAATFANWLDETYEVRLAHDAEEALEVVDDSVDAVLLDRRLPDRPGAEVLAELRSRGYDGSVAIITAVDPDFDILEMGFDDYVVKPVLRDDLIAIVERLLRLARYEVQFRESFGLVTKLAALEDEKPRAELDRHDEYQATTSRFESVKQRIEATLEDFDDEDFTAAYRSLTREHDGDER